MEWLAWQLADSAFPTGAFAHSAGLEAAVDAGLVGDLEVFMAAALQQHACQALPIIAAVHDSISLAEEADWLVESYTTNHVANRSSRSIGQALLASAAKSMGCEQLTVLRKDFRRQGQPCHQPVMWAVVTGCLGLAAQRPEQLYLFAAARDLVSSAVRLGLVGPTFAQVLLRRSEQAAQQALVLARGRDWRLPAMTVPLQDVVHGRHDHLYSRLFHS
jgi:urease accessory protein